MIVVDASVVVTALLDDGTAGEQAWAALNADVDWYSVPHLHAEVFSGIRGRWLGGKLGRERAEIAVANLAALAPALVDTGLLLPRMWELRDNVGALRRGLRGGG